MTSRWLNALMASGTDKKVISLRLAPHLARAFKMEAARQDLKLNALFEKIFQEYLGKAVGEKRGKYNQANE